MPNFKIFRSQLSTSLLLENNTILISRVSRENPIFWLDPIESVGQGITTLLNVAEAEVLLLLHSTRPITI
jgi:hypothetical protein